MGACIPERQHLGGHIPDRGVGRAVEGVGDVGAFRALHQPGLYVRPVNPEKCVQQVINDCSKHTRNVFSRRSTSTATHKKRVQQVIHECNNTRSGCQVYEARCCSHPVWRDARGTCEVTVSFVARCTQYSHEAGRSFVLENVQICFNAQ